MASWISHMIIVDQLYAMGIDLDERGFTVGNVAPDCNVENDDWTKFTPSRKITHWMRGESKLTADYEGFFEEHIKNKRFLSVEHKAFLWGYYAHLVTDVEFQKLIVDDERVKNMLFRIKQNDEMYEQIKGLPENFDTLKEVFGRNRIGRDVVAQEMNYLLCTPGSRYLTVLKTIRDFPNYIDYFPQGAITRKIGIMATEDMSVGGMEDLVFFPQNEYNAFTKHTSELIYKLIHKRI